MWRRWTCRLTLWRRRDGSLPLSGKHQRTAGQHRHRRRDNRDRGCQRETGRFHALGILSEVGTVDW